MRTSTKTSLIIFIAAFLMLGGFSFPPFERGGVGGLVHAATINSSMSQPSRQGVGINRGLVGWWTMDGADSTATTVLDKSGNGFTGTRTSNVTPIAGKIGQAMNFNGTGISGPNSIISVGYHAILDITGSKTVSVWIKTSSFTQYGGVVNNNSNGYGGIFFEGALKWRGGDTTGGLSYTVPSSLLNKWIHIAVTQTGTNAIMYINGVVVTSGNNTTALATSAEPQAIGALPCDCAYYFNGSIDDVRIYNRALSAAEVKQLYAMGSSATINKTIGTQGYQTGGLKSGLVGWWTMDGKDVNATQVLDKSGQGNVGTRTAVTPVIGKLGQAMSFNGTTSGISTPLTMGTTFTWSAWFKARTISLVDYNTIIGINTNYMLMDLNNGMAKFWSTDGLSDATLGVTGLQTGKWYHLVFVRTGDSITNGYKAYLNGNFTGQADTGTWTATTILYIGTRAGGSQFFDGLIDDVRVYDRALSANEIQQLYAQGSGAMINTTVKTTATPLGINSGLVGYWTFDGKDVSGTQVYDKSGQNNTGTSSGGVTKVAGKLGQGYRFDGSTGYVTVGNSVVSSGPFSYSLWINRSDSGDWTHISTILIENYGGTPANGPLFGMDGSGNVYLTIYKDGDWYAAYSTIVPGFGKWYHVVGVYDPSLPSLQKLKVYVNSALSMGYNTGGPDSMTAGGTPHLSIGRWESVAFNFAGILDDVRVYNKALSAQEIQQLYQMAR